MPCTIETAHIKQHLDDLNLLGRSMGRRPLAEQDIQDSITHILRALDVDQYENDVTRTPERVAKMYREEVFAGLNWDNFPSCTFSENVGNLDELVAVRGISVRSMCQHHLLPFIGVATVGYIPSTRILGLSKFNRIVDFFSRRPQVQETLIQQIHAALCFILETPDVAVIIEAQHFCTIMRGVKDTTSSTVTSRLTGRFRAVDSLRQEFLALHNHSHK